MGPVMQPSLLAGAAPSAILPREGNDPLPAQDAGSEPVKAMSKSVRVIRLGNASG